MLIFADLHDTLQVSQGCFVSGLSFFLCTVHDELTLRLRKSHAVVEQSRSRLPKAWGDRAMKSRELDARTRSARWGAFEHSTSNGTTDPVDNSPRQWA